MLSGGGRGSVVDIKIAGNLIVFQILHSIFNSDSNFTHRCKFDKYMNIYSNIYMLQSSVMKKKIMIVIFILIDISPNCDTPDRLVLLKEFAVSTHRQSHMISDSPRCLLLDDSCDICATRSI